MKKNSFQPRVPNYCDFGPLDPIEFNSFNELLETSFIKHKANRSTFKRFSISDNMLMLEETNGKYWVIGFIKHPELLDLPKWCG
jgi:hypothetical protein